MFVVFVWLAELIIKLTKNICLLQHLEKQGTWFSNQKNKNVTFYFSSLIKWGLRAPGEEVIMLNIKM